MNKIQLYFSSFVFLTVLFSSTLNAQQANSLYYMRGVPQVYQINPAFQPDCNFFLGLPGVSPLKLQVENSSFGLNDVIKYDEGLDSLITFLHPNANAEDFFNLLGKSNYISTEFSMNIASFGFRTEQTYFTFDIRERFDARFSYTEDYLRMAYEGMGNDTAREFDLSGLGLDVNGFMQFSMGVSQKFGDRLSVGWRGKLLFGQANLTTEKYDLSLYASEDLWRIDSDIKMRTNTPYLADYMNFMANAPIAVITEAFGQFEDLEEPSLSEIRQMVINPYNFGLAMDVGVDYRMFDWLQLSASLVDFGSIKWKDGAVSLEHNISEEYTGVEVYYDEDDDEAFLTNFLDTLEMNFDKFTSSDEAYTTWLPAKIYLGAAFYPHPKVSFGLLSRTDIYKGKAWQQFTLSANLYPIRMLSTTFSYSIINGTYKNIGLGLGLKAGPLNMYLMSDTGPSIAFFPYDARYFNFKLGFNLMFGCKKKEKKFDVPLVD